MSLALTLNLFSRTDAGAKERRKAESQRELIERAVARALQTQQQQQPQQPQQTVSPMMPTMAVMPSMMGSMMPLQQFAYPMQQQMMPQFNPWQYLYAQQSYGYPQFRQGF